MFPSWKSVSVISKYLYKMDCMVLIGKLLGYTYSMSYWFSVYIEILCDLGLRHSYNIAQDCFDQFLNGFRKPKLDGLIPQLQKA